MEQGECPECGFDMSEHVDGECPDEDIPFTNTEYVEWCRRRGVPTKIQPEVPPTEGRD